MRILGVLGDMSPVLRSCVPLVSYGGYVVIEWIVAGVLVSLARDDATIGGLQASGGWFAG